MDFQDVGVTDSDSVARLRAQLASPLGVLLLVGVGCAEPDAGWRTIAVPTTEVTSPDVAVTPDGSSVVFGLLGHLFRLPAEGGEAEQLTFGPYFDARPTVSPDGSTVAFQSDRDGSEGNIFLMNLPAGEVSRLTSEAWADAPAWAPNGESLVYLSLDRGQWGVEASAVRRVWIEDGRTETLLKGSGEIRSPFVLQDGRPGWAVIEWQNSPPAAVTHIQIREPNGTVSTLRTVDGVVDALLPTNEAMYARHYTPRFRMSHVASDRAVVQIPLDDGPPVRLMPASVLGIYDFRGEPRFAWSAATESLYVGTEGGVWKITPSESDAQLQIPFVATVEMETRETLPPPPWTPPVGSLKEGSLLIRNVRVLDFDVGGFSDTRSILVEDGIIVWIDEEDGRSVPQGSDVLDAEGRFAIPGLFEMHGHNDWCSHPSYLELGITSMRNLGAELDHLDQYRAADPGSTLNCFFAGQVIANADFTPSNARPADEMEARSLVRRMRDAGATMIKLHTTLPWPYFRAAADEAWIVGLPSVGHASTVEDIVKTATVGGHPTHSTGANEDLINLLSAVGARVDVTLQTTGSAAAERAHRLGVTVLVGTDFAPVPRGGDPAGPEAFHAALASLNQAGLSPMDVLAMATLRAAETLGAEAQLGSLEPGKVADIVLLDGNPLEDMEHTRSIWRVVRAGFPVNRGRQGPMP